MATRVRSLSSAGIERFEAWLINPHGSPPQGILSDESMLEDIALPYEIDKSRRFESSYELGVYLCNDVFKGVGDRYALLTAHGMWTWIALAYIDSLLRRDSTSGRPLAKPHYINVPRLGYRLIPRTAWDLVSQHGDAARVALGSTKSPWGEMAEQMTSRQEIYANRSFWRVASLLYGAADGGVKRGATSQRSREARRDPTSRSGLGGVRRLPFAFKQFERTYNLRKMSEIEIVELLPREYEKWRSV